MMNVPAYLKPESGAVGRALGAWLDHAPKGLATRFVLLWFVLLYTAFAIISSAPLGLHPDLLATYARGLHPAAGYAGAPPLAPLMTAAWFALFPPTNWAFYLLAMVNAAIGLFATDRIAVRYLDGDKRIVVPLLLLLTPFYQFMGQRFGADQSVLSTWPIATWCFLRAFETRTAAWSAVLGVAAALALLGDYYSVFLIAGFVAAVLVHPGRREYLRSRSPWLSIAAGGIALAPHIQWLFGTDFATFGAAVTSSAGTPFVEALWSYALYITESTACLGALLAVYWIAVRPDRTVLRETSWPSDPGGHMLVVLLATPLALSLVAAPFVGLAQMPLATMPVCFLLPVILLRPKSAGLTRVAAIRITALVAIVTLLSLAAAPWLAWRRHVEGTAEGREYYRLIGAEITNTWHLATGLPLRIAMGDPNLASAVTFYSPDHPDSMPGFDTPSDGGGEAITSNRLASDGWVAICNADDEKCVESARQRASGKSNVQFVTYSTTNRYLGKPSKLGRFFFILAAPESKPLILLH